MHLYLFICLFVLYAQKQPRGSSYWRTQEDDKKHDTRTASNVQINIATNSGHTLHKIYYSFNFQLDSKSQQKTEGSMIMSKLEDTILLN
uniref:Putative secreted protein n=1 Tax=Ixodes ricinus TaxID=34613 RepID=A0A147BIT0_IXORI